MFYEKYNLKKKFYSNKLNNQSSVFSNKQIYGFTIVELLVTMSIMAVAFGLVTVNYRDFQRAKQLENARREVITAIRRAQQVASSGAQNTTSPCDTLLGVTFTLTNDEGSPPYSYRYYANCSNGNKNFVGVDWKSLPEGVISQNTDQVLFNNIVSGGTSGNFNVILENESGTVSITVYPGGRIE